MPAACLEHGLRQTWIYHVEYSNGDSKDFCVPCEPLTISFENSIPDMTVPILEQAIFQCPHQKLYTNSKKAQTKLNSARNREDLKHNILKLLRLAKAPPHFASEVLHCIHNMNIIALGFVIINICLTVGRVICINAGRFKYSNANADQLLEEDC